MSVKSTKMCSVSCVVSFMLQIKAFSTHWMNIQLNCCIIIMCFRSLYSNRTHSIFLLSNRLSQSQLVSIMSFCTYASLLFPVFSHIITWAILLYIYYMDYLFNMMVAILHAPINTSAKARVLYFCTYKKGCP